MGSNNVVAEVHNDMEWIEGLCRRFFSPQKDIAWMKSLCLRFFPPQCNFFTPSTELTREDKDKLGRRKENYSKDLHKLGKDDHKGFSKEVSQARNGRREKLKAVCDAIDGLLCETSSPEDRKKALKVFVDTTFGLHMAEEWEDEKWALDIRDKVANRAELWAEINLDDTDVPRSLWQTGTPISVYDRIASSTAETRGRFLSACGYKTTADMVSRLGFSAEDLAEIESFMMESEKRWNAWSVPQQSSEAGDTAQSGCPVQ